MMSTRKKKKIKKDSGCWPGASRTIVRLSQSLHCRWREKAPGEWRNTGGRPREDSMMSRFRPRSQPRSRTIVLSRPNTHIAVSVYAYVFPYGQLFSSARSRTIIRFPRPEPGPPRAPSENSLRKPAETLARDPEKARFRPRTRTNLRLQSPEQAPKTASSPRTGCVVLFYRILFIIYYILWFMFDNVYIWCYVHHARLSQTLEFSQFIGNLFFCLRCNIFLNNVLLADK